MTDKKRIKNDTLQNINYKCKNIFKHPDDYNRCIEIINTILQIKLIKLLCIPMEIIVELGEYSTGDIIQCGGANHCKGEILVLSSHNIFFNNSIINIMDNNHYNMWNNYIYRCSESNCKRELNIFKCHYKFNCKNRYYKVENGDSHGIKYDNNLKFIRTPTGVCTNCISDGKCHTSFCHIHWSLSGNECAACGDFYCYNCKLNGQGMKCFNKKCNKWFCDKHQNELNKNGISPWCQYHGPNDE